MNPFINRPLLVLLSLLLGSMARAHVAGLSQLSITAHENFSEARLQLSAVDINGDGLISEAELFSVQELLTQLAPQWFRLTPSDGGPVAIEAPIIERDNQTVLARFRIAAAPRAVWRLELLQFARLASGHRELVTVRQNEKVVSESLLSANHASLEIRWQPAQIVDRQQPTTTTFAEFLRLGVEHILTGYDHLLYLAALLIASRRLADMAAMITSFTLAHSITLALATTGLVTLPSHIVEPIIAASIVFVALQNLWAGSREIHGRWIVAFVFGLIHGFGFASLLREAGIGTGNGTSVLLPLFSFNLGVELGQLAIVALVLPLYLRLKKTRAFATLAVPTTSAVVLAMGSFWLIQRLGLHR